MSVLYKYNLSLKCAVLLLLMAITKQMSAQCPIGSAYLWTTFTPSTVNVPVIATGTWKQNIIDVNVVAGNQYSVGNCNEVNGTNGSGAGGTSVTVWDAADAYVIAYAAGPGQICATFTAPYTGKVRARYYKNDCSIESIGFTAGAMWLSCQKPLGMAANNVTSSSVDLSWTSLTQAGAGYEYVLDDNPANPTGSGNITTQTVASFSGLSSGTTYYFHLRTRCSATFLSNWETISFTTASAPFCAPPGLITSNFVLANSVDLTWVAAPGSGQYEYVLSTSPSTPVSGYKTVNGTFLNVNGLAPNTTYYFNLRNVCSGSTSKWITHTFTTIPCSPPTNVYFSNISNTTADVLWSQMSTANNFEYKIDLTINTPPNNFITTTGNSTYLKNLQPDTKYYFFVRSRCFVANDSSNWRVDSFITKYLCEKPQARIVSGQGTNEQTITWDPVTKAVAYEYALSSSINPPAFGKEIKETLVPLSLPNDNTSQYVHIRTKCNSQFSLSEWTTIALRTTGISNVYANDVMHIYPNPVTDKLLIDLPGVHEGHIALMEITGKTIYQASVNGEKMMIDMKAYATGVYMLRYTNGNVQQTIKITKQ